MKKTFLLLPILIFLAVYVFPLNIRPLVDPDETRYAEIPREMIASGDYVVPRLVNVRYFEKPVMGYWLTAASIKIFGENRFAVRFPAALLTGLTALVVFLLGRTYGGGPLQGALASLIHLSFLEVFGIGVFNTLDGPLTFFLTASVALFFQAWSVRDRRRRYFLYLALSGVFCGLACHTKGFLAIAVPVAVIVPFLAWEGCFLHVFRVPWIPIGVAALVMLPWGIAIHLKESDFWNFFFWNEHVRRFLSDNAQHKEPFYYFFAVILLGAFPWTIQIPAAIAGLKNKPFNVSFNRYILCWLLFPFLLFSASSGKLATYILPCFPPLALLMAHGLTAGLSSGRQRAFNIASGLMILFPVIATAIVLFWQYGIIIHDAPLFSNPWKIVLFVCSMSGFAALLFVSIRSTDVITKLTCFALSPLMFYASAHALTPDQAVRRNSPCPFIESTAHFVTADTIVVSASTPIKSVCWALKRSDVFLLDEEGELSYGFGQETAKHRHLSFQDFGRMIAENKGRRTVLLYLDERRFKRWKQLLPEPASMEDSGPDGYIMAVY